MPDPRHGVFETLLVIDGRPVELDAHLARLEASLEALFPDLTPPPQDVPSLMHPYGRISDGTSTGALRITIAPGASGELELTIERRKAPGAGVISLRGLRVPGGLGAHKWADRSLLDEAQTQLPADTLPLLVDGEAVLEASRANIFAVRDGALLTPPLDGRILPGVTRMRVIDLAGDLEIEAREVELSGDDLIGADEVFVTGSVRGIEKVAAIDGVALPAGGEVAASLAAELWRTWLGAKVG